MSQFVTYLIHQKDLFLSFRSTVEIDSCVNCASVRPSIRPSVCLSTWNSSAVTERIFIKFDIRDFIRYKYLYVNNI